MKYANKEIKDLTDEQLLATYSYSRQQELEREKAGLNDRFKPKNINGKIVKLEFPPINPAFLQLKQELLNEIQKRKLKI